VTGTGPLGCVPAELAMQGRNGECGVPLQTATNLFNPQLVQLINQLNAEIGGPNHVFIYANAFAMHLDFVANPQAYGIFPILIWLNFCSINNNHGSNNLKYKYSSIGSTYVFFLCICSYARFKLLGPALVMLVRKHRFNIAKICYLPRVWSFKSNYYV